MAGKPVPTLGRTVLYVLEHNGVTRPAVITNIGADGTVGLTVLTHPSDKRPALLAVEAHEGDTPGTWHWPSRAE